jgi:hypothetical protein
MATQYVTFESLNLMWEEPPLTDSLGGNKGFLFINHEFYRLTVTPQIDGQYLWVFATIQTHLIGREKSVDAAKLVCIKHAVEHINRGLVGLV